MSKTKEKTPTTMSRWQKKRNWQSMLNVDHKLSPSSPTFVMVFMVVRLGLFPGLTGLGDFETADPAAVVMENPGDEGDVVH